MRLQVVPQKLICVRQRFYVLEVKLVCSFGMFVLLSIGNVKITDSNDFRACIHEYRQRTAYNPLRKYTWEYFHF